MLWYSLTGTPWPMTIQSTIPSYTGTEWVVVTNSSWSSSHPSILVVMWLQSGCLTTNSHLTASWYASHNHMIPTCSLPCQLPQKASGEARGKDRKLLGHVFPITHRLLASMHSLCIRTQPSDLHPYAHNPDLYGTLWTLTNPHSISHILFPDPCSILQAPPHIASLENANSYHNCCCKDYLWSDMIYIAMQSNFSPNNVIILAIF